MSHACTRPRVCKGAPRLGLGQRVVEDRIVRAQSPRRWRQGSKSSSLPSPTTPIARHASRTTWLRKPRDAGTSQALPPMSRPQPTVAENHGADAPSARYGFFGCLRQVRCTLDGATSPASGHSVPHSSSPRVRSGKTARPGSNGLLGVRRLPHGFPMNATEIAAR